MQVQAVCEVEGELVKLPPPLQDSRERCGEKRGCKLPAVVSQPCIAQILISQNLLPKSPVCSSLCQESRALTECHLLAEHNTELTYAPEMFKATF